jgi:putative oxidoreductase
VLAGGMMILFGWHARWAALVLVVWMIPVTLAFHAFWTYPPEQVFNQTNHFLKNIVVIGFLLHIIGLGGGPYSLNDDKWDDAALKT